MKINSKTIIKLRQLINEDTEYRGGRELVKFFNQLGFSDTYGEGFPSRWIYTEEKLNKINGTSDLDKCIRQLFAPINFIGNLKTLDDFILDFNKYLMFDDWKIVREGKEINFKRANSNEWETNLSVTADDFLSEEINIDTNKLKLENSIYTIINNRLTEIDFCIKNNTPLAAIFLIGSTLEGILLSYATQYPKEFNMAKSSPKFNDKVKAFHEWKLSEFIDTCHEIGFIKEDVRKFSHSIRDFRNYIHPYQQLTENFHPNLDTAKICYQVLKAAINQLSKVE